MVRIHLPEQHLVVPHVGKIHPLARQALRTFTPGATFSDVSVSTDAYWKLIARRWRMGKPLLLVEHDIAVGPDTVSSFAVCPEPWCIAPYWMLAHKFVDRSLGCTRFSSVLMEREPELIEGIVRREWRRLDTSIADALRDRGYVPHLHDEVKQHHFRPQRGVCDCRDPACPRVEGFDRP